MPGDGRRDGARTDLLRPGAFARRWWPAFGLAVIIGATAGYVTGDLEGQIYESEVVVLVGPVVPDVDTLEGAADLARTYGEVVESRSVIEGAVADLPVDPGVVDVAASAGRGSATMTIRVRTPSRDLTPAVTTAVVDSLAEIVGEATPRSGTSAGIAGATLTVIDDGGGRASEVSLGPKLGMAMGVVAAMLVTAACSFAVETRRNVRPWSEALADGTGASLGFVETAPVALALLTGRHRRGIAVDSGAQHQAESASDLLHGAAGESALPRRLFVTAISADPDGSRGFLQLVAALDRPPTILDPGRLIADLLEQHDRIEPDWRYRLHVGRREIAQLVVPTADPADVEVPEDVEGLIRAHVSADDDAVVFLPVDRGGVWQHWAAQCDCAVVLVRERHLGQDALPELLTRLRSVQPDVRGGILIRRRWLTGQTIPVDVDVMTPLDRLRAPLDSVDASGPE